MLLDTPQTRLLELNLFTKNIAKFTAVALYFDAEPRKFLKKWKNFKITHMCRYADLKNIMQFLEFRYPSIITDICVLKKENFNLSRH